MAPKSNFLFSLKKSPGSFLPDPPPSLPPQLIVKVLMSDGSSKALRVDKGQTVGDVLEVLLEKTHCDGSEDWSLTETQHQLQTGETLEEAAGKVQHLMLKCVVLYVRSLEGPLQGS